MVKIKSGPQTIILEALGLGSVHDNEGSISMKIPLGGF